jgi:hypothetical protein|tara:strand:+ start:1097 stop:1321 length:225 start_codon:yes stop_codon:yes gene_type:complete
MVKRVLDMVLARAKEHARVQEHVRVLRGGVGPHAPRQNHAQNLTIAVDMERVQRVDLVVFVFVMLVTKVVNVLR